jgi:hypothetical protein
MPVRSKQRAITTAHVALESLREEPMTKTIATIASVLLCCMSTPAHAERARAGRSHGFLRGQSLMFGVDTELGVPLGNYSDGNSVGGGALLTGELTMLEALSLTARIGVQLHTDRTLGTTSSHVHAIPFLLGTKYYIGGEREGLFGSFELGMFDLITSITRTGPDVSSNDIRFGMGAGLGFQQDRWSARVSIHTQDVGNFGNAFVMSGGIGYQFVGL